MGCIEGSQGRNNMETSLPWVSTSLDRPINIGTEIRRSSLEEPTHWHTLFNKCVAFVVSHWYPKASPPREQASGVPNEVQRRISAVRSVSCVSPSAVWWRPKRFTGRCWAWWLSTRCAWPSFITTSPRGCPVSSVSREGHSWDICPSVWKRNPLLFWQIMQSSCSSLCSWLRCFWRCTAWGHASTSTLLSTASTAASVLQILLWCLVPPQLLLYCLWICNKGVSLPLLSVGHCWQHLWSAVGFLQAWNVLWHQRPACSPSAEDLQDHQVSAAVFLFFPLLIFHIICSDLMFAYHTFVLD